MSYTIPEYLDKKVVEGWVGKQDVVDDHDTGHGLMLLVVDKRGKRKILRFFAIGGTTHCSVDFDEDRELNFEQLFRVFVDSFK